MVQLILFVLTSIGIGLLFSILGILLGFWLEKNHKAPNRYWLTIILCLVSTFVKRIWLPDLSFFWFG
jgi:hypothetical protein